MFEGFFKDAVIYIYIFYSFISLGVLLVPSPWETPGGEHIQSPGP